MNSKGLPNQSLAKFDLTAASTLHHLIVVGVACVALWLITVAALGN